MIQRWYTQSFFPKCTSKFLPVTFGFSKLGQILANIETKKCILFKICEEILAFLFYRGHNNFKDDIQNSFIGQL